MTAIPEHASEVITETWDDGSKRAAFYQIDGQDVAYRWWDEDGYLALEYGIQNGVMHGTFRTWYENGQICEESTYDNGKEHGISKQYDAEGNLIGAYTMEHGSGLDLWFSARGVIAEERYYVDGQRHGFERWWNSDNATIWMEGHFRHDEEHGIFREWNAQGRLCRGFPRYMVAGRKVDKRQYQRACRADPSLPPFVLSENRPQRQAPPAAFTPPDAAPDSAE